MCGPVWAALSSPWERKPVASGHRGCGHTGCPEGRAARSLPLSQPSRGAPGFVWLGERSAAAALPLFVFLRC